MKTADARAVEPIESEDLKKQKPPVDSVNLTLEQIEQRASAKTKVLNAILEPEERPSWRHWGLNE